MVLLIGGKIMFKNTTNSYGIISRIFHWLMALGIIGIITVGYLMTNMENSQEKWQIYGIHKSFGALLLLLVSLRLGWRLINISPNLPRIMASWERIGYKAGVFFMYILMITMPISGIIMSRSFGHDINIFSLFTIKAMEKNLMLGKIAANIHSYSAIILSLIIGAHTLIALYHHFVKKDILLRRMVKGE